MQTASLPSAEQNGWQRLMRLLHLAHSQDIDSLLPARRRFSMAMGYDTTASHHLAAVQTRCWTDRPMVRSGLSGRACGLSAMS